MANLHESHTPGRDRTAPSVRPAHTRPAGRHDRNRSSLRPVDAVLADLAATRVRYESLRQAGGAFGERARLVSLLHELRAEAALVRHNGGPADA